MLRAPAAPVSRSSADDLEDFFENGAVPLHLVGPDGTILRANKAELVLLGYQPHEYIGRNIAEFHVDRASIDDILARLSRGDNLDRYPARLRAKDGSTRQVEITSSVRSNNGEFINTRCFSVDVTHLRRAEDALREKEKQLQQILNALPAAVYTTDKDGKVTYFNPAAEQLAGRRPVIGADQWCVTWRLRDMNGNALPHEDCPMAVALKEKRPVRGVQAFAERPDGTLVPFAPFPTPLYDETGELTGAVNMLVDISEQKQREQQIEFVMRELSHRSKNLLAVVHSIAMRTIKNADSYDEFQSKFMARLQAMARTHDLLIANDWSGAGMRDLVRSELSAFDEENLVERVEISGEDMSLSPTTAQNISLAIHELATNAIKYGAFAHDAGQVAIDWRRAGDEVLRFSWRESNGHEIKPPSRQGFGTQILSAVFDHARFEYKSRGMHFTGVIAHR